MKKTSFFLGALFGIGILLSFWDNRFIAVLVLILIMVCVAEYNGRPDKKNSMKALRILADFEESVHHDFEDEYLVSHLLDRYPVRRLCYLREGVKWQIFHHRGSDFPMSLREEQMMDEARRSYEELLCKVEKRIPDKYLD